MAVAGVVLVIAIAGVEPHLQLDRGAILNGQVWRVLTGHLTHWSGDHLLWDLLMFVILGAVAERMDRRRLWLCLGTGAIAISGVFWVMHSHLETYRGLSGLDSALFVLVAICLLNGAKVRGDAGVQRMMMAALLLFVGKIGVEIIGGDSIFVSQSDGGFVTLPLAHATGAAVGAAIGWWRPRQVARCALGRGADTIRRLTPRTIASGRS